jgi:uncharacterized membrane protein
VDYYGKERMVNEFFAAATNNSRRQSILQQFGVDYVFYGPAERALGGFDPSGAPYLNSVLKLPRVDIYKVVISE